MISHRDYSLCFLCANYTLIFHDVKIHSRVFHVTPGYCKVELVEFPSHHVLFVIYRPITNDHSTS